MMQDDELYPMIAATITLTAEQVDYVICSLESMPETPVGSHLVEYLKYQNAAARQELLLRLNGCATMNAQRSAGEQRL